MKYRIFIIIIIISTLILLSYFYLKKRRTIEEEIVYSKILQMQELATAKQIYKEIIYSQTTGDFLWLPVSKKEFLISLDYSVTAGIDIKKGYRITRNRGFILITLPKGEILSIDALDTSIKQYFVKERFSSINKEDYFRPINESKKSILEGEEVKNLIIQCEENAAHILISLLKLTGINARVEFDSPVAGVNE